MVIRHPSTGQLPGSDQPPSWPAPTEYEDRAVKPLMEPLARLFLDRLDPRPGARLLDVACGTGVVSRLALAKLGPDGTVAALDPDGEMLAAARVAAGEAASRIAWRRGQAETLPYPDGAFDVVVCQQGLQYFADRRRALREMHRVLAPGGRVGLCVWRSVEHNPLGLAAVAAVSRLVGVEAAEKLTTPFSLGNTDEVRRELARVGFRTIIVEAVNVLRRMGPPEESIRAYLAASPLTDLDPNTRAALTHEIGLALRTYATESGLAVPTAAHVVLARRAD